MILNQNVNVIHNPFVNIVPCLGDYSSKDRLTITGLAWCSVYYSFIVSLSKLNVNSDSVYYYPSVYLQYGSGGLVKITPLYTASKTVLFINSPIFFEHKLAY